MGSIDREMILVGVLKQDEGSEIRNAIERESELPVTLWLGERCPFWLESVRDVPHLPRVLRTGHDPERGSYLVLEPLEGMTLEAMLHGGSVPEALSRSLAGQAAELLDAIHRTHPDIRPDLSPASLFICEDGALKVLGLEKEEKGSKGRFAEDLARWGGLVRTLSAAGENGKDSPLASLAELCASGRGAEVPANGADLLEQYHAACRDPRLECIENDCFERITAGEPDFLAGLENPRGGWRRLVLAGSLLGLIALAAFTGAYHWLKSRNPSSDLASGASQTEKVDPFGDAIWERAFSPQIPEATPEQPAAEWGENQRIARLASEVGENLTALVKRVTGDSKPDKKIDSAPAPDRMDNMVKIAELPSERVPELDRTAQVPKTLDTDHSIQETKPMPATEPTLSVKPKQSSISSRATAPAPGPKHASSSQPAKEKSLAKPVQPAISLPQPPNAGNDARQESASAAEPTMNPPRPRTRTQREPQTAVISTCRNYPLAEVKTVRVMNTKATTPEWNLLQQALTAYYNGNETGALESLARLKPGQIDDARLCLEAGWLYWELGHAAEARRFFTRGLELEPDNTELVEGLRQTAAKRAG